MEQRAFSIVVGLKDAARIAVAIDERYTEVRSGVCVVSVATVSRFAARRSSLSWLAACRTALAHRRHAGEKERFAALMDFLRQASATLDVAREL
jgi:hypothetical protein